MRALCWTGVNDLRVESVADPEIINPGDVILKVRLTTTCGSMARLPPSSSRSFLAEPGGWRLSRGVVAEWLSALGLGKPAFIAKRVHGAAADGGREIRTRVGRRCYVG